MLLILALVVLYTITSLNDKYAVNEFGKDCQLGVRLTLAGLNDS